MDWNLKIPSWGFNEFEQEPNSDTCPVESSSFGGYVNKGDFSVDLKLGHVVNRVGNESVDHVQVPSVPKTVSGSSKRSRTISNGIQASSCLVDGCQADLSNCREYHRRHKVCEKHSKTPEVEIGGFKRRFCQQCSRFHSLEAFDEGKRSCRKRLDGHNRRRRKPQPESLSRTGTFVCNYQGTTLFTFAGPEVYPSAALANPMWPEVVKTRHDLYDQHLLDKQTPYPGSSSNSFREEEKQFNFLQTVPEASSLHPFHKTVVASSENGFPSQVLSSNCALSLLSSPMPPLSHMLPLQPPTSIPLVHPLDPSLHSNNLESMDSLLIPDSSDTGVHCQGMYHMGRDSSSENEASQTLPFCWE